MQDETTKKVEGEEEVVVAEGADVTTDEVLATEATEEVATEEGATEEAVA